MNIHFTLLKCTKKIPSKMLDVILVRVGQILPTLNFPTLGGIFPRCNIWLTHSLTNNRGSVPSAAQ